MYETFDRGDTIMAVGPGIAVNGSGRDAVSYGAPGNPDVVYIGSNDTIFVRTGASGTPFVQSATFPGNGTGATVRDIVINQADWQNAFVCTTAGRVFSTSDAGATWAELTGDLPAISPGTCFATAFVPADDKNILVVGTAQGVFYSKSNQGYTTWKPLGSKLPSGLFFDLDYDAGTDVLVAGSLGRGTYKLPNLAALASQ